ncbi:MAG: hypothetical protein IJD42_08195 [Clostridia bacterium]|nr:hypothetical protein [Clostridia bacterium]
MSEAEKKKREDYVKNRRTWIIVQIIVAVVLALDIILSLFTYYQFNKSQYVEYTEDGFAEYYVLLEENEFYDEGILDGGQAYVTELIDAININFNYKLKMDSNNVDYNYRYFIDAIVEVKNSDNDLLYSETENLACSSIKTQESGEELEIDTEKIDKNSKLQYSPTLDFKKYNKLATSFIETYQIKNAKASLNVRMQVDVAGNGTSFKKNNDNSYFISLNIPLATQTTKVTTMTSINSGVGKTLAYNNNVNQNIFKFSAVISSILEVIVITVLIIFVYKSRNYDINYTIKVKKILSSYKSYIQRIMNEIDTTDYQLLYVETFREMLEIRDTIGAPILMNENEDKTRSRFFILTNTKIVYLFEIKVENYDEIYGNADTQEKSLDNELSERELERDSETVDFYAEPEVVIVSEPTLDESPVLYEEVIEEKLENENEAEPEIPQITEEIIQREPEKKIAPILSYLDNDGNKLEIRYSRSFEANLIQSDDTVKEYYNELKNYIMSFKGVKSRFSWKFETFNKGRNPFFKIKLRGKTILLYCAVDPESIDKAKYRHDAIDNKLFADVPTLLKIKAGLNVRRAKEIIDLVMSNFQMEKNQKAQEVDYKSLYPYEDNESLIEKGLIKTL